MPGRRMNPGDLLARARRILEERDSEGPVDMAALKAMLLEGLDRHADAPEPEPITREEAEREANHFPPGPKRELMWSILMPRVYRSRNP